MGLFSRLLEKVKSGLTSSADLGEIEKALIESDLGATNVRELLEIAKISKDEESVLNALRSWLSPRDRTLAHGEELQTVLVVGVNGTGKTTTSAKWQTTPMNQQHLPLLSLVFVDSAICPTNQKILSFINSFHHNFITHIRMKGHILTIDLDQSFTTQRFNHH